MTLEQAFFQYFIPMLASTLFGVGASLWITGSLWRTCRSLSLRVIDLEQAHVQVRNRNYANKRWQNQEQLEAELGTMMAGKPAAPQKKYDNDPLDF